jgi:hypothetical protein
MIRTFNLWGHVSKAERVARRQALQDLGDAARGRTWRVYERPEGPDEAEIRHAGIRYRPGEWRSFQRAGKTREEALALLERLAPRAELTGENEWRWRGMRYRIEQD